MSYFKVFRIFIIIRNLFIIRIYAKIIKILRANFTFIHLNREKYRLYVRMEAVLRDTILVLTL